jgi:DNA helicase-2/ATP-dependent DNA helicase PcrA
MALGDDEGLEEEQRLFYVAITRARDTMTIYTPARMPTDWNSYRARQIYAKASRFLTDDALTLLDIREHAGADVQPMTSAGTLPRIEIPVLEHLFK